MITSRLSPDEPQGGGNTQTTDTAVETTTKPGLDSTAWLSAGLRYSCQCPSVWRVARSQSRIKCSANVHNVRILDEPMSLCHSFESNNLETLFSSELC